MPWGSLSNDQRIRILLEMVGGPAYKTHMQAAAKATTNLAEANMLAQKSAIKAARGQFFWNQAIYTMRRYMFFATLGVTALIAEVVRLGFSYNSAMQQAKAMLRTIIPPPQLKATLDDLFVLAARTPFQFKDTVRAFQLMYIGFRPFGISIKETTSTIEALTNGLAVAGKVTPANLQRVSIALQHMAFAGRLTGYAVNQLWRDGIPMANILNKEMGITGDQLHTIASLGISTADTLKAIRHYLLNEAPFKGAAWRSQIETLQGAFSTFKDILSQASGSSSGGLFRGLTKFFQDVDNALVPYTQERKPISLAQFVSAIDQAASPKTHLVIMTFQFFLGVINGLVFAFRMLATAITVVTYPLRKLYDLFGGEGGGPGMGAKMVGFAAGILIFGVAARRAAIGIRTLAQAIRLEAAAELGSMLLGRGTRKNPGPIIRGLAIAIRFLAFSTFMAAAAFGKFLLANPIILGIALLVVLYFKWKRFHDETNKLWRDMIYYAPIVGAALTAAFGPIGAILTALILVIRYWKQLKDISAKDYTGDFKKGDTKAQAFTKGATLGLKPPGGGFHIPSWLTSPLISHFALGGTVPGPIGMPQLITAHGGEKVTPVGQSTTGGQDEHVTHIVVELDNKVLAEGVAKGNARIKARK